VIVGDELFMTTLSKISRVWLKGFGSKSKMVGNYGLDTLQAWGEAFESRKYLYPHIYGTYTKLRAKTYIKFPGIQYDQRRVPIFLGPISVNEKQFVADYLLENQQMDDIDLLHFSESDDEFDDHHTHAHPLPQPEEENHTYAHDDFFGLHMDTSETAFNFPETVWPTTQSSFIDPSFTPNWQHQPFSSNTSTAQELLHQEYPRDDLSLLSQVNHTEPESKAEFDWSQFDAPSSSLTDAEPETKHTDKFHFFDDEKVDENSLRVEDFHQQKEEPPCPGDQFMTLDPFQDVNFMTHHEKFSRSHHQLIQELDQQLKSTRSSLLKDENNPGLSNSPSSLLNLSQLKDTSQSLSPPSQANDDGHSASTHLNANRPIKKFSPYYDPSSDSKNRVVYFGTQRIIKREG
jgi:hypothetical protein